MKRSEINDILASARSFINGHGFHLPGFAELTPAQMSDRREELAPVFAARLGWDITDYGLGRFSETGLFLFTLRNGSLEELRASAGGGAAGMCYAEKIMISRRDQLSPMHRHIVKTEDIINRGGGKLAIRMFESDPAGKLDEHAPVTVHCDGIARTLAAGDVLILGPGESVTLRPGNWHAFWGDGADVLIGEVSTVNDDMTDNIFAEPLGRFAEVEEDCPPDRLLVSDYGKWLS